MRTRLLVTVLAGMIAAMLVGGPALARPIDIPRLCANLYCP